MNRYMLTQRRKIEIDKWLEGCRIGKDPGMEFVFNRIQRNAEIFCRAWEQSLYVNYVLIETCGHEVKRQCAEYKEQR